MDKQERLLRRELAKLEKQLEAAERADCEAKKAEIAANEKVSLARHDLSSAEWSLLEAQHNCFMVRGRLNRVQGICEDAEDRLVVHLNKTYRS